MVLCINTPLTPLEEGSVMQGTILGMGFPRKDVHNGEVKR